METRRQRRHITYAPFAYETLTYASNVRYIKHQYPSGYQFCFEIPALGDKRYSWIQAAWITSGTDRPLWILEAKGDKWLSILLDMAVFGRMCVCGGGACVRTLTIHFVSSSQMFRFSLFTGFSLLSSSPSFPCIPHVSSSTNFLITRPLGILSAVIPLHKTVRIKADSRRGLGAGSFFKVK